MLRAMPTSEFVKQIEDLSELCRHGDDPIILTRQGHGDLVVMGIQAYNKLITELRLIHDVAEANARLVENETLTDEELIDQAMQLAHDKVQNNLRLSDAA
jgi:PHD/YefM family antitoxin component YafN of YafNO toxin-antitoxin module